MKAFILLLVNAVLCSAFLKQNLPYTSIITPTLKSTTQDTADKGKLNNLSTDWKGRRELLKSASMKRVRPRKKLSFEERYDHNPLKADSPTVDFHFPADPFSKWYLCYATIDPKDGLRKRQEVWSHYIQWARRSVLGQSLINISQNVANDYEVENAIKEEMKMCNDEVVDETDIEENESKKADLSLHLEELQQERVDTVTRLQALTPPVKVEWSYTLLSEDCLRPQAQVMAIRANDTNALHDYLQKEPLANHGVLRGEQWDLYELCWEQNALDKDEDEDWTTPLTCDAYDPYMFLSLVDSKQKPKKKQQTQRNKLLDASRQYHLDAAAMADAATEEDTITLHPDANDAIILNEDEKELQAEDAYQPLYDGDSRIVSLGRLYSIGTDGDSKKQKKKQKEDVGGEEEDSTRPAADSVAGQLLVFNARSRADAFRYLKRDPVAKSVDEDDDNDDPSSASFDSMTVSAVNMQDVSGLNHMMGRSFGEKTQLDMIHFLDPEDILQENEDDGLLSIDSLPDHFRDNQDMLDALRNHSVSFRYNRLNLQDTYNSSGILRSAGKAGFLTLDAQALSLANPRASDGSLVGTRSVDQEFDQWNRGMSNFQRERLNPDVVMAAEAVTNKREAALKELEAAAAAASSDDVEAEEEEEEQEGGDWINAEDSDDVLDESEEE